MAAVDALACERVVVPDGLEESPAARRAAEELKPEHGPERQSGPCQPKHKNWISRTEERGQKEHEQPEKAEPRRAMSPNTSERACDSPAMARNPGKTALIPTPEPSGRCRNAHDGSATTLAYRDS